MNSLQRLMNNITGWSDSTFGSKDRNPSIVYHLKKEVDELIEAINVVANNKNNKAPITKIEYSTELAKMEYADCFILLLDSAQHFKISAEELINLANKKLEINKSRAWGKPDENGVCEHVILEEEHEEL